MECCQAKLIKFKSDYFEFGWTPPSSALLDQCLAHLDNMENLLVRAEDEQVREMMTLRSKLAGIIALLKIIDEEEIAAHLDDIKNSLTTRLLELYTAVVPAVFSVSVFCRYQI